MSYKIPHPQNPDWSLEFMKVPTVNGFNSYKYVDINNPIYGSYIIVDETPTKSTMVQEFLLANPNTNVIEILDLFVNVDLRNNGIGTGLLKMIQELYHDSAILLLVGASEKEYPKLDEDYIPEIISKLLPFYEKNNFVNVNNRFGSYSNHIPMLYVGNDIGKEIAIRYNIKPFNGYAIEKVEFSYHEEEIKKTIVTDKEKLQFYIDTSHNNAAVEDIIRGYIDMYNEDFPLSRLANIESMLNELLKEKINRCESALYTASENATYLKSYLEGSMYTTREAAEEHVDVQIKNVDKILDSCKDALN